MKIFHYTTIETLALILKHRTLRFNCASNVNDPDEGNSDDFKESLAPHCFISCWTYKQVESIPLWKIYAANGKGVRLESDTRYIRMINENENNPGRLLFIVKNVISVNPKMHFINLWQDAESINPYFKTNYSDEKRIFKKDYSTSETQQFVYDVEAAFNTKKTCWSYEEEIRFILLGNDVEDPKIWESVFHSIPSKNKLDLDYVDLKLDQDFFDNLKITCGPLTEDADKIIVNSLIEKFDKNKKMEVFNSKIKMRK